MAGQSLRMVSFRKWGQSDHKLRESPTAMPASEES